MKKKSFRNFKLIESGLVTVQKIEKILFAQKQARVRRLKIPERLFTVFKLSTGKKPIEYDDPELLEAKCSHSKPVFVYVIQFLQCFRLKIRIPVLGIFATIKKNYRKPQTKLIEVITT